MAPGHPCVDAPCKFWTDDTHIEQGMILLLLLRAPMNRNRSNDRAVHHNQSQWPLVLGAWVHMAGSHSSDTDRTSVRYWSLARLDLLRRAIYFESTCSPLHRRSCVMSGVTAKCEGISELEPRHNKQGLPLHWTQGNSQ